MFSDLTAFYHIKRNFTTHSEIDLNVIIQSRSMQITKDEFEELRKRVEDIEEIISIIFDKELMESLARGKKDIEEGKMISLEEYEKKYIIK